MFEKYISLVHQTSQTLLQTVESLSVGTHKRLTEPVLWGWREYIFTDVMKNELGLFGDGTGNRKWVNILWYNKWLPVFWEILRENQLIPVDLRIFLLI